MCYVKRDEFLSLQQQSHFLESYRGFLLDEVPNEIPSNYTIRNTVDDSERMCSAMAPIMFTIQKQYNSTQMQMKIECLGRPGERLRDRNERENG